MHVQCLYIHTYDLNFVYLECIAAQARPVELTEIQAFTPETPSLDIASLNSYVNVCLLDGTEEDDPADLARITSEMCFEYAIDEGLEKVNASKCNA